MRSKTTQAAYPVADDFFARALKLPVWHREADIPIARQYASAIRKVIEHFGRAA